MISDLSGIESHVDPRNMNSSFRSETNRVQGRIMGLDDRIER